MFIMLALCLLYGLMTGCTDKNPAETDRSYNSESTATTESNEGVDLPGDFFD